MNVGKAMSPNPKLWAWRWFLGHLTPCCTERINTLYYYCFMEWDGRNFLRFTQIGSMVIEPCAKGCVTVCIPNQAPKWLCWIKRMYFFYLNNPLSLYLATRNIDTPSWWKYLSETWHRRRRQMRSALSSPNMGRLLSAPLSKTLASCTWMTKRKRTRPSATSTSTS